MYMLASMALVFVVIVVPYSYKRHRDRTQTTQLEPVTETIFNDYDLLLTPVDDIDMHTQREFKEEQTLGMAYLALDLSYDCASIYNSRDLAKAYRSKILQVHPDNNTDAL